MASIEKHLITALYAILDPARHTLTFANAGHQYPYLIAPMGTIEWESSEPPLGAWGESVYENHVITLSPDMLVLFYTDGIIEAFNAQEEMFGYARLEMLLNKERAASPEMLMHKLYATVTRFAAGRELDDDATVVAFRLTA